MAKKSTFLKNWQKNFLQIGILLALILFISGLIPSKEPADPEKYCPMGGLQALTTYVVRGSLPCSMSSVQIVMGIALAAAVILFSKLFCGYLCPVGTVEELMAKLRKALHIKPLVIRNGSVADSILRIFKYILLFWIFYSTATASELFCKNLDPYYAVATGFKGEITLWMSITTVSLAILGGFFINMFWCKYFCPLGAIANSLKFWLWIGVLFGVWYLLGLTGLNISWVWLLGAFCLLGWLLEILHRHPKLQLLHVVKDMSKCNHCGLCEKKCPYNVEISKVSNSAVRSVDCTLCGECVAACSTKALNIGVARPHNGRFAKYIPVILTLVIVAAGIWAGNKIELPTINETWGIETVRPDSTVVQLVDPSTLKTMNVEGLRSVKCYGSSMAFKARLEQIKGVHGVKTYVNHHRAEILYDPAVINEEAINAAIYVPSKFRVATPDHNEISQVKVMTIRTENMYDKMDVNYLGLQIRQTDKRIYGLQTEFACPLIVRVYMHPEETIDEDWCRNIVEMKQLEMPTHGGGSKIIDVDYKFCALEKEESFMDVKDYLREMFSPFKAQFAKRVEEYAGQTQYIYEIEDHNYEKPIYLRNMPYLSNHLSHEDGIIGIYLNLNKDLVPAIQVRYARPMTAEKLWELMTMDTWTITYGKDDVRETPAKIKFDAEGNEYIYEEEQ